MSGGIAEATRDTFQDLVSEGTVLVDVWGPDCQPCLALEPHVEELAEIHAGELKVVKLEAPKARRLCMSMGLMGLPIFLLFRDGAEVARLGGGTVNAKSLTAWLDEQLAAQATGEGVS